MAFLYFHHSGRFDRSEAALVRAFDIDVSRGADIIAYTEVDAEGRWHALKAHAESKGWKTFRPGEFADDVAYLWDAKVFKFVSGWGKILSTIKTYSHTGHLLKPFAGTFLVLIERSTGKRFGFGAAHTPSHVDIGRGWRRVTNGVTKRVKQYIAGMPVFNLEMRRMIRAFNLDERVASFDFNLDLNKAWARTYIKGVFPSFRLATDAQNAGTHGFRRIDGILLGKMVKQRSDVKVYPAVDSDHRVICVRVA